MGWFDSFSYWVRDNVTDPISNTIERAGNAALDSLDQAVDRMHAGGNDVIDAVCDPIGTVKDAATYISENPGKTLLAAAGVAVAVGAVAAKSTPAGHLVGTVYGPNKKGGGHDHRYNTGEDRTPSQLAADAARAAASALKRS